MTNGTEPHRRWRRRAIAVIGLGVAAVVAVATPALGHPVFSNDAPGFPNLQGSVPKPYPAGSRPTLNMFVAFEQEGVIFNGAENTTVDVKVTVPAGWTSPACGAVSTSVGYRQVGTVVPGWTCTIETADGHQVLHWSGPQISPAQTFADSAQFVTFQVTVPSPATQTSYGATGGPEGFYVEQRYADGATSLWRTPNSPRPGEVANGIVRTVASITAPPPASDGDKPTGPPPPEREHGGPEPPPAAKPGGGAPTPPPAAKPGGGGPTPPPAAKPPPTSPPTATATPSEAAQGSSTPTPTEPPPGIDPQPSSAVDQLAQQRDEATGQGVRWQVVVGTVLALVLVAAAVIALVRWRRR
ncbi:MAG: hypothetical protein ACRDRA_00690, partial [Pseudonocardiaceae bacterium]